MATFGIIIDVVIVLILVVCGLIGYKKGFLKTVLSLASWFVCTFVAVWLAKYVASWINGIYDFSALIGKKIASSLSNSNAFFAQAVNTYEAGGKEALLEAVPTNNKLLTQLIKIIFSNANVDMTSTDTIGYLVGYSLGKIIMVVISGILVFIVLKIVSFLLGKLIKKIEQTKVLGGLNKVLGLVLGLVKASLIIVVINVLLVAISMIPVANKVITTAIQNHTYVEKVIYNQTDKLFGKYVIEGNTVKNWVENLWKSR